MPSGEEGGYSPPPKDTTMPILYLLTLAQYYEQYYEQYLGQHLGILYANLHAYPKYTRGHTCERCAT